MGVIQRQGSKHGLVRILSVLIGMISLLWIYPIDLESYGYAAFIYGSATLLTPFLGFGLSNSGIKFFKEYQEANNSDNGLFYQLLLLHTIPIAVFIFLCFVFNEPFYHFLEYLDMDAAVFKNNQVIILLLAVVISIISTTTAYISNYGRIVVPSVIQDLGYKFVLPIIILATYAGFIIRDTVPAYVLLFFVLALGAIVFYGVSNGFIKWPKSFDYIKDINVLKSLARYSAYGMLATLGALIALRIDVVMITSIVNKESTGIYSTMMMMAAVIDLPQQAISKIAGPVLSKSWTTNNVKEIRSIYNKASINSLILAMFIFLGIWFNIDGLFSLSSNPETFVGLTSVFLYLGIAKVVDAMTSINTHIIIYSKWYRYNLIFLLVLGVINILLNVILIKNIGIEGAAIATCVSIVLYNVIKYVFIKYKLGYQPFDLNTVKVLCIGALVYLVLTVVPSFDHIYLDLVLRSSLIAGIFLPLIYWTRVSPDLNNLILKYMSVIKL